MRGTKAIRRKTRSIVMVLTLLIPGLVINGEIFLLIW